MADLFLNSDYCLYGPIRFHFCPHFNRRQHFGLTQSHTQLCTENFVTNNRDWKKKTFFLKSANMSYMTAEVKEVTNTMTAIFQLYAGLAVKKPHPKNPPQKNTLWDGFFGCFFKVFLGAFFYG